MYEAHFLQSLFPEILLSITNHSELVTWTCDSLRQKEVLQDDIYSVNRQVITRNDLTNCIYETWLSEKWSDQVQNIVRL